jgi:DNA-binding transcriptional ArsR family regulator
MASMRNRPKDSLDLKGNTLRAYIQVLKHGPCELKDVQRGLGLSSPSLASYHLKRLMEAGFVYQDEYGRYVASKDSAGDVLAGYSKIGTAIVPQFSFFAVLFTILLGFFSYEIWYVPGVLPYFILVSLASAAVLWYETFRLWRRLEA